MEPQDMRAFGLVLDQLAAVFRAELTLPLKQAYWSALNDLPLEAVLDACTAVVKTEHFFPVPALLRDLATHWVTRQREEQRRARPQHPLALREDLVSQEEVRQLLASIWPEERDRWAKDPIPPYAQEDVP